jgi:hypothetical protein
VSAIPAETALRLVAARKSPEVVETPPAPLLSHGENFAASVRDMAPEPTAAGLYPTLIRDSFHSLLYIKPVFFIWQV